MLAIIKQTVIDTTLPGAPNIATCSLVEVLVVVAIVHTADTLRHLVCHREHCSTDHRSAFVIISDYCKN